MTTQDEDTEPDVSSPIISDGVCEESGTTVTEVGENPNSQVMKRGIWLCLCLLK